MIHRRFVLPPVEKGPAWGPGVGASAHIWGSREVGAEQKAWSVHTTGASV